MSMTAWYGEPNAMNGKPFDNLPKAISFLKRKRAKVKYVKVDSFERVGKVSVSTYVRIEL